MREIPGARVAINSHVRKRPYPLCYTEAAGAPASEDAIVVYVCLCDALTDRQVKQAAATAGTTKPSTVHAACGCRAQCGQCVKALVALLRGGDCATPELQGAD